MLRPTTNGWAVAAAVLAIGAGACNRPAQDDPAARDQTAPGTAAPATDARRAEAPAAGVDAETSPAWITTKIQAQYFVNPEIKPWNIDVTTTSDGVVTLRGEVDSADDRAEAIRIARGTDGVSRVEDHLRVQGEREAAATTGSPDRPGSASIESPDVWVTSKIQAKYFTDADVKGLDIDVTTREGVVTLTGQVDSQAEKRQAVALARNTDGVREVQDQLQVRSEPAADAAGTAGREAADEGREAGRDAGAAVNDVWITTKIQSKYFLDTDVKGHEINVDTRDGVVTLNGTVASDAQKQTAEAIARETQGVARVENRLAVSAAREQ